MRKTVFHRAMLVCAIASGTIGSSAIAQEDYTAEWCQRVAQRCINNYELFGYSRGSECFDALTEGNCPEPAGVGPRQTVGDKSWDPKGVPVVNCVGRCW